MKKAERIAIVTVLALFLLIIFVFRLPTIVFQEKTWRWESQIKREQDPEKLRSWAKEILERNKDNPFQQSAIATNRPPVVITTHREFTLIYYSEVETNGRAKINSTQDHVNLAWDFGAWTGIWGMQIGDTNFVSQNKKLREWKPGIYFYKGGSG